MIKSIYIIYNPYLKITKIGISKNPKNRLMNLIGSCGCKLILFYYSKKVDNAIDYESKLHLMFDKYRTYGEWFRIDPEKIKDAIFLNPIFESLKNDNVDDDNKSGLLSEMSININPLFRTRIMENIFTDGFKFSFRTYYKSSFREKIFNTIDDALDFKNKFELL